MRFGKTPETTAATDLEQLLGDLRNLLSSQAPEAESAISQIRQRLADGVDRARVTSAQALEQSKVLAQQADDYVSDSPWRAVGGALAVGALLGFMLSKR